MTRSSNLPPRVQRALTALRPLHHSCLQRVRAADTDEHGQRLLASLERLIDQLQHLDPEYEQRGRDVLLRLQSQWPDLWGEVDRELLWFFGGDCLHFLSDEEIQGFQERDDETG